MVIGTGAQLYSYEAELAEVNWLGEPLRRGDACELQNRYRAETVPAHIEAASNGRLSLRLPEGARAIAPGQSGALYDGDRLLGGGVLS